MPATRLTLPALARIDPLANTHAKPLSEAGVHLVFETRIQHTFNTLSCVLWDDIERGCRRRGSWVERDARVFPECDASKEDEREESLLFVSSCPRGGE